MSPAPLRNRARERLWTVGFTFLVTLVFGAGVSCVHVVTQERVRENEQLFQRRAIRAAAGLPALPDAELPAWIAAAVREVAPGRYRVAPDDGAPVVEVVIRAGPGLWGRILAAVGIVDAPEGRHLAGVAFLEHSETPGLGARIVEPWYVAQVRGKRGPLRLVPELTRSSAPDEIDAITGATITSVAVRDILNRALAERSAPPVDTPEGSVP